MTVQDGLQNAMLSNSLSFAEGCTDGPKCRLDSIKERERDRETERQRERERDRERELCEKTRKKGSVCKPLLGCFPTPCYRQTVAAVPVLAGDSTGPAVRTAALPLPC